MVKDSSGIESHDQKTRLLKDQVRLVKRKDCNRYDIAPIQDLLSFEKGFFIVIRACQMLAQKNDGIVLVGVAGPSGAGKTIFTEKILNFMPDIAIISIDNYNDSSRLVDGNFDDPRLTDYDTLLRNVQDLKDGKQIEVPIYDYKNSTRVGYRTMEVPSSRIVIIEGIYALSEKLRPLLDLRVSVTGGVHADLVKRVFRDIQRAGQEPEAIIQQISETVYPMYKAFIEPDLKTAHIKIINKFNPFTGFQSPTYVLKSGKSVSVDQIKASISEEHSEDSEETYDIYLLPPGEDPESCQSYLRMRNKEGKYNLMFEEWVTDNPFVISPRISFEVSVRLLGGLMTLGYTIATILKRSSHVFTDDKLCVKIDWLEQLNRQYVQVQGRDRIAVRNVAEQLGLEGSYIPRTYIEQVQLEKLVNEVIALPEDLKTKLSLVEDLAGSSPNPYNHNNNVLSRASANRSRKHVKSLSHSYSTQSDNNLSKLSGFSANNPSRFEEDRANSESSSSLANQDMIMTQLLSEQISTLNDRIDVFTTRMEELNSNLIIKKNAATSSQHNNHNIDASSLLLDAAAAAAAAAEASNCNGSAPTSYFISGLGNGSLTGSMMHPSSPSSKLSPLMMEEISSITRTQRQMMHQLDNLSKIVRDSSAECSPSFRNRTTPENRNSKSMSVPLTLSLAAAVGCLGIFLFTARNKSF